MLTALLLLCQLDAAADPPRYAERPAGPLLRPSNSVPRGNLPLPPAASPPNTVAPLFGCNDCDGSRRKWVSDVAELKQAAARCGFDFISIRFTQYFAADSLRGRLVVFARTDGSDSLIVDSALTACISPLNAEEVVTVYHHQRPKVLQLTLPGAGALKLNSLGAIDDAVRIAATFRSRCRVKLDDITPSGSWQFMLQNRAFLVEKGRIETAPVSGTFESRLSGDIAYRLETWGSSPLHAAPLITARGDGPEIIRFDVNDSSSICRVRLECASDIGLDTCSIVCGTARNAIDLQGVKYRSVTAAINVRDSDSLLVVAITDIHGNRVSASRPIFGDRRRFREERGQERAIELLTREQARGNPLRYGAYLLSRMSGDPTILSSDKPPVGSTAAMNSPSVGFSCNPVGSLLKKLLRNKAETYLAAIVDPKPAKPLDALSFPRTGMVYNGLFVNTAGAYTTSLLSDNVVVNGTRIAAISNPTLRRAGGSGDKCTFSFHAPFISGRYPLSWSIDTTGAAPYVTAASTLLLCAKAECRGPQITLYDIPYVLPKPDNNLSFTLYHATTIPGADTLTFTWCIRYADRTFEIAYRRFSTGPAAGITALSSDAIPVETAPYALVNTAGERCYILPVRVQGAKSIFRVDAFVHSLSRNEIVGWGSASCRG